MIKVLLIELFAHEHWHNMSNLLKPLPTILPVNNLSLHTPFHKMALNWA